MLTSAIAGQGRLRTRAASLSSHTNDSAAMSLFRRRKQGGGDDNDLTLRPVRSAVEALGEANRLEERNARRRSAKAKRSKSKFFSKSSIKSDETAVVEPLPTLDETLAEPAPPAPAPAASNGPRRKIYMNQPLPPTDLDHNGDPTTRYVRNKVRTTSECAHCSRSRALTKPQSTRRSRSCPRIFTSSSPGAHKTTAATISDAPADSPTYTSC